VTTFQKDIILKDLAALQLAKDLLEGGTEVIGVNLVEDLAHLGVAGDGHEAENRAKVVIQSPALEGKQGGVLEGEQGQARHQGVGQREGRATTLLGQSLEATTGQLHQR